MDPALLSHPLVPPTPTLSAAAPVSPEDAARLRALDPQAYWLEIARELSWVTPPTTALDGTLGDFRHFPGATGNVSTNCLDRHPRSAWRCATSARTA